MMKLFIDLVVLFNYGVLYYVAIVDIIFIILMIFSFKGIFIHMKRMEYANYDRIGASAYTPPISVLVPCYNEEKTVASSVSSLLDLDYPEYEVLVINDGSKDSTLDILKATFELVPVDIFCSRRIPTETVYETYVSTTQKRLTVINKANGGKADALNAGINYSGYPLVVTIDADSILEKKSLVRVVRPFVESFETVAAGGIVRVANGCTFENGLIQKVGLSKNWLSVFQTVEYLRAFLSGRVGWSQMNGLLIVSGAFGIFRKDILFEIGGYKVNTVGEDMELIVNIHKHMRSKKLSYRIEFIPDPVCWTQSPEDLKSLKGQRQRWHRGLIDTLLMHRDMLFNPRYGLLGMVIVPYYWLIEMLGPVIETMGYLVLLISLLFHIVNVEFAILFFIFAVVYGIFMSVGAIVLEEYSFRKYEKTSELIKLFIFSIIENFGYRQTISMWRFLAFFGYRYRQNTWGTIKRLSDEIQKQEALVIAVIVFGRFHNIFAWLFNCCITKA